MTDQTNEKRALALDVHPRSFGFVVFEGPNRMLDWGVRSFRTGVNAVKISAATKFLALLDEFGPSAVVVRERLRRTTKQTKMLAIVARQARSRRIPVRRISRGDVNRAFVGFERNKYEVAFALARQFPDLASRLPLRRKCWQSEDYRMGIFDAAAVGVAYFVRGKAVEAGEPAPLSAHSRLRMCGGIGLRASNKLNCITGRQVSCLRFKYIYK